MRTSLSSGNRLRGRHRRASCAGDGDGVGEGQTRGHRPLRRPQRWRRDGARRGRSKYSVLTRSGRAIGWVVAEALVAQSLLPSEHQRAIVNVPVDEALAPSHRLHWFPYEITRCAKLQDSGEHPCVLRKLQLSAPVSCVADRRSPRVGAYVSQCLQVAARRGWPYPKMDFANGRHRCRSTPCPCLLRRSASNGARTARRLEDRVPHSCGCARTHGMAEGNPRHPRIEPRDD